MYVIWTKGGYYLQNDGTLAKDFHNAKIYKSLFLVHIKSLTSSKYYYMDYEFAKRLENLDSAMKTNTEALESLLQTVYKM